MRSEVYVIVVSVMACVVTAARVPGPRGAEQSSDPAAFCGHCDMRNCPSVAAEECPGRVVKDQCGCCPICDMGAILPSSTGLPKGNSCEEVRCNRNQICVLNIQTIPICRCPSLYWCRRKERKEICGRDGNTYKSRCYLQVAECSSGRKIRVAHKGGCTEKDRRKHRNPHRTLDGGHRSRSPFPGRNGPTDVLPTLAGPSNNEKDRSGIRKRRRRKNRRDKERRERVKRRYKERSSLLLPEKQRDF